MQSRKLSRLSVWLPLIIIAALTVTLAVYISKYSTQQEQTEYYRNEMNAYIASSETATKSADSLSETCEILQAENAVLKAEKDQLAKENSELQLRVGNFDAHMAANQTQTEELNNQIIELQEKIAQLTTAPVNYGIIDNTDTLSKHEYETETAHFGYWLYMPENAETSEKPLPMIVFLHSGNGTGTNLDQLVNFDYGMARYLYEGRLQPNAVIVMPQSPNGWTKDYDQLFEFITAMADIYNVDKSRISLTGVSRGGIATFEMLLRYDDYFFRAMPIASAGNADLCKNIKTPLWIVHGENDTGMGFSVIDIDRLINENGGTCKLQMLPGAGHTGQYVYYEDPEVMAWLTGEDLNT